MTLIIMTEINVRVVLQATSTTIKSALATRAAVNLTSATILLCCLSVDISKPHGTQRILNRFWVKKYEENLKLIKSFDIHE